MTEFIVFLATGCYSGYLPKAPGTWGSALAVLFYLGLGHLELDTYLAVLLAITVVGTLVAGSAEKIFDRKDPGAIVIDEIAGMLLTLAGAPLNFWALFTGFLLFRLFDILKPWPVRFFDQRLNGGPGIMLDDIMAGLYGLAALQILLRFVFPVFS